MERLAFAGAFALLAMVCASLLGVMQWVMQSAEAEPAARPSGSLAASEVEPSGSEPSPDRPTGQLQIEGRSIQELSLIDDRGRIQQLRHPADTVSLPVGTYTLQQVQLKGGYVGYARPSARQERIRVTTDAPCRLAVGAPLEPRVTVTRWGKSLELSYELVDARGLNYTSSARTRPAPQFVASMNGRQVGSGSFKYG